MLFSFISIFLIGSWVTFHYFMHIPELSLLTTTISLQRIPAVVERIFIELFNIGRWNLLWPTFIISLFIAQYSRTRKLLVAIIGFQFLSYFIVFLLTSVDPTDRVNGSLDRLLLQIAPLVIYFIAITFSQLLNYKQISISNLWYNRRRIKKKL